MFIIQIIDADGEIRYVSVRAGTAAEARNIAAAQAGLSPSERIQTVANRQHFEGQNIELPTTIQEITSGTTGTTGTKGSVIGDPPVPSDDRTFLEAFQPGAAFRSALQGTGRDVTTSPFGRTISSLQPFFQTAFLGDIAARAGVPVTGETPGEQGESLRGPFEQFVRQTGLGGLGRLGGQAFEALSATGGAPLTGGAEALRRSFATPQTQGERERAANLGLLAAANKFSPFAAFNLLPTGAEIARQAETAQFRDPGKDFLSFLRPSVGF
jgi:hypothetical protein